LIAAVFQIIGVILLSLFIYLNKAYLSSPLESLPYFENLGEMLKIVRDLTNHLGVMVATGLGNLILYYIFYNGKFIPKWLSIWGFIGNTIIISASFLLKFQSITVVSVEYGIMTIPLVFQQIVLAVWLMVKGLKIQERENQI
jgi:hypothetical protein